MSERKLKVLVTGADGFVGRHLMQDFANRAIPTRAATRSGTRFGDVETVAIGDLSAKPEWAPALDGVTHVVHLAGRAHVLRETADDPEAEFQAINAEATRHLVKAAKTAGVKHFILVSSISVYDPLLPHLAAATREAPQNAYGRSKLAAEQMLREHAGDTLSWTILRPPLVYGPEVRARFHQLLKLAALPVPLPLRNIRNMKSLIHVKNLTDAIITSLEHTGARSQMFLLSDGEDISTPNLIVELAQGMGRRPTLFPFPKFVTTFAATLAGQAESWQKLTGTLTLDTSHFANSTGWTAPISVAQGLRETAQWYVATKTK